MKRHVLAIAACAAVLCAPAGAAEERAVPQSRAEMSLSFAPLVRKTEPAVVNIYTKRVVRERASVFGFFFGDQFGRPRERVEGSLGSGVIVAADGVIVTNNHVIAGADQIRVALGDRREFPAKVIVADDKIDLAVLKIDTGGEALPTLAFADSEAVETGDLVLAIGNPFGVGQTVTSGIVSATARTGLGAQSYIQTDAAVNPGNSGGALIDMQGRLLGINTMIVSKSGSSAGVGFAIPANLVKSAVASAMKGGKIVRPWLGASGQDVTSDLADSLGMKRPEGVLVNQLWPGGVADQAGLKVGDVILGVDGKPVSDDGGLVYRLLTAGVGGTAKIQLLRDGKPVTLDMPMRPAPETPARDERMIDGKTPFAGVTIANLSPAFAEEIGADPFQKGVMVTKIAGNALMARYGAIRPGDLLVEINGQKVTSSAQAATAAAVEAGRYNFAIRRGNGTLACVIDGNGLNCRQS